MKKFALILAAAMTICTLAGCGEKDTASTSESQTEDTATTSNIESEYINNEETSNSEVSAAITESTQQAESTTSATSEAVSAPEDIDEFVPVITDKGEYKNGSWLFEAENSEGEIKSYLYNVAADEVIEFTPEMNIVDFSGFTVVYKSYERTYAQNIKTDEIYFDTDNNEHIIRSDDIWGKDKDYFVDNTLLVLQKETGFDKGGVWMGVVRDDGTWDFEMRADYQLPYHSEYDRLIWKYYGNGVVANSAQVFVVDTNEYIDEILKNAGVRYYLGNLYDFKAFYCNDDVIYFRSEGTLIGYNKKNKNIFYKRDSEVEYGRPKLWGDICLFDYTDTWAMKGPCVVYDMEAGKEVTFDTTNYDSVFVQAVSDNVILFKCEGADKNMYLCAINANGDRVLEPVLTSELTYINTTSDGNIITLTNDSKIKMINGKTGEITDTAINYSIVSTYENSDIAIVEVTASESTNSCYMLVDLNDPANIIDPFNS